MYPQYNPKDIESKWRREWQTRKLYHVVESEDKPKYYCLDFFPYSHPNRWQGERTGRTTFIGWTCRCRNGCFQSAKIKEMTGNGQAVEVNYVPGKIMNILPKPSSPD